MTCLPFPSSEYQLYLYHYHYGGGDHDTDDGDGDGDDDYEDDNGYDGDDNGDDGDYYGVDDDDVDQFSVFALGACAECVILAGEHKWILGAAESHIGKNKILAFCKSLPHTFFTLSSS